jgi:hypothetical protein
MFPLRFPYYGNPGALPSPIPTLDEIECSEELLSEAGGTKVVGVGPYVIKFGRQVNLAEGENMVFLAHTTSVPVPFVYALFKDRDDKGYIIMERITANTLESEWPSLSDTQKKTIATKIRSVLKMLRSLPSPGGYCSLGNRSLLDHVFWAGSPPEKFYGPFRTGFNEGILGTYVFSNGSKNKAEFYKQIVPVYIPRSSTGIHPWRFPTKEHTSPVSRRYGT